MPLEAAPGGETGESAGAFSAPATVIRVYFRRRSPKAGGKEDPSGYRGRSKVGLHNLHHSLSNWLHRWCNEVWVQLWVGICGTTLGNLLKLNGGPGWA